ncbi:hypothetical protein [Daejeonella oryzae]|uniref:hypothetical protein n=1 Tax=Daejeonella oryzae TaxID=1122943 RepID=UPI000428A340|nr:hypothetical protein [Daejeonella oryzae]
MKKKIYLLAMAIMFTVVSPAVMANETSSKKDKAPLTEQQIVRLQNIEQRVLEIKEMDKSNLSRQERKDLRKELVQMKKEAAATSGGVYLSVGAIIIIILLLILIL